MSNVCEATLIKSLFWDPSGLNKLLEMCFEFPSHLIGKLTYGFFEQANHGLYLIKKKEIILIHR